MKDAGIFDNDVLIVDRSETGERKNHCIVIEWELMVRRYHKILVPHSGSGE